MKNSLFTNNYEITQAIAMQASLNITVGEAAIPTNSVLSI